MILGRASLSRGGGSLLPSPPGRSDWRGGQKRLGSIRTPAEDAVEMIQKLAKSERVAQVFVRHVFRFWMGRNETINDALVLQDASRAYKDNGGSMKALLTSLLTSDAFLYRTVARLHPLHPSR